MRTNQPASTGNQAFPAQPPHAFFCSQSCPGDIILKAQDWANALGPRSPPVIGGFHTAVERDVLRIVLRGQAPVIIVLARSLAGWRAPTTIKTAIEARAAWVISPFPELQRRTTHDTAMLRNRHILTLCRTVLFAHASPGGRTESLAHEAAAAGLTLLTLASPANANLISLGANTVPLAAF